MTARDDRFARVLSSRARVVDVRDQVARMERSAPGVARPGGEGAATLYVVHHSAGAESGSWDGIWRYHLGKGWSTGGYHGVVAPNGTIYLTVPPSRMTYGAGPRWNPSTVHLCAVGNYEDREPSEPMLEAIWQWLCTLDDVVGYHGWRPHRAIRQTACPGRHLVPHVYAMSRRGSLSPRPQTYR